jgi:hypothetical protein
MKIALRLITLSIILLVLSGIGSNLIPANEVAGEAGSGVVPPLALILVVFFFQSLALALPVLWSRWHGWRLSVAIFVVYFGTVTALTQVESLVYLGDKMPGSLTSGLIAMGFFVAAVFSPICVLVLGRWKASLAFDQVSPPALNLGQWGWRVLASGAVFLCLYYLFGYYIAWQDPALREYYGGTDPGSFFAQMKGIVVATPWMIPLQYVRGLLYVGLGLLVIYSMRGPWWQAGLALSLILAAPALYLLFPNPVMPDFPRMTHFIETLPYQFLFGWFLAWFLHAGSTRRSAALA